MSLPHVAIVGATGAVGNEFLRVLEQREFPLGSLKLLASRRSAGKTLRFRGEELTVEALADDSFRGTDLAFFSAGGTISRDYAAKAVASNCAVIDNSSAFRLHDDVPLVVPEVNSHVIKNHSGILANPNCSTIILVIALEPLRQRSGLHSVMVSTYQAASGAGQRAMDELYSSTRAALDGEDQAPPDALRQPLAFNVFPQVDDFMGDGFTREEDKMLFEARKILELPELKLDATCVRVPVARCHSESVSVQLERQLSVTDARELFNRSPGLELADQPSIMRYPMPRDYAGRNEIGVGRIRLARVFNPGLTFWLVGDQLRKGAALNALQIAEAMQVSAT